MRNLILATVACGVLGIAAFAAQQPAQPAQPAPPPRQTQPTPSADPYANNPNPGATQFPLAAPAGKDSGARTTAPAGAVNQGPFDPGTWKYGAAFNPRASSAALRASPARRRQTRPTRRRTGVRSRAVIARGRR